MSNKLAPLPLPVPRPRCDVCAAHTKPANVVVCRTCCNRFWCNSACQDRDRAVHYYDCSPLEGPLSPPAFHLSQLDAIVAAAAAPLGQWNNYVLVARSQQHEVDTDRLLGAKGIQSAPQSLPPPLRCHERMLAADAAKHPFRAGIVTLSRLFLMHFMARRPSGLTARLTHAVARVSQIDSRHPLYVPKILTRPADLSPGEYAALIEPMMSITSEGAGDADALEKWGALYTAHEELWDVEYE